MFEIEREILFCYFRSWQEKFVVRWFYWSAQTIRVVSQIYREQKNRRDVSQSGNTDDTITDKTGWIILSLLSLMVWLLSWFEMAKASTFEWHFCWPSRWIETFFFFLRNRKQEKETAFWSSMLAFPYLLNSDIYIDLSYLCDIYYV